MQIPELDPPAVQAQERDVVLLDVREVDEWTAGRVEGAVHIPMSELPGRLGELDAARTVVAVCRSGNRSAQVTAFLNANGFDAYNLRGGVKAWQAAGLRLVTPDGGPGRVA